MTQPRPHDLIWLRNPAAFAVEATVPDWVDDEWLARAPVVVRRDRDRSGAGRIPVGLRGRQRGQRHAAWIAPEQCDSVVSPCQIADRGGWRSHPRRAVIPALQALDPIAAHLDGLPCQWGITGAVGFTLASGIDVLHPASDLDLLIVARQALSPQAMDELGVMLGITSVPLDVQIATPAGAFALREWLRTRSRVLLKTDTGPILCNDPWRAPWPHC